MSVSSVGSFNLSTCASVILDSGRLGFASARAFALAGIVHITAPSHTGTHAALRAAPFVSATVVGTGANMWVEHKGPVTGHNNCVHLCTFGMAAVTMVVVAVAVSRYPAVSGDAMRRASTGMGQLGSSLGEPLAFVSETSVFFSP